MPNGAQETRTERVSLAVTPSEKRAIEFVAMVRGVEGATILRQMSLESVLAEYARMLERLRDEGAEQQE